MKIFIVSEDCKTAVEKATMEKPPEGATGTGYPYLRDQYKKHLASLQTLTLSPDLKVKPGQELKESEVVLVPQLDNGNFGWEDCIEDDYFHAEPSYRRILALPAQPVQEGQDDGERDSNYDALKPISDRINYFASRYHKYEANELHDALNVIMRLVPPEYFTAPVPHTSKAGEDDYFKYTNVRTEIEAIQYKGNGNFEVHGLPKWIWEGFESGELSATRGADPLILKAHGNKYTVNPSDYIIKRHGYLQVSPEDAFHACYERASGAENESLKESLQAILDTCNENETSMEIVRYVEKIATKALAGYGAKQGQEIEFAEWLGNGTWDYVRIKNIWVSNALEKKTTAELYTLFTQSLNNKR